MSPTPCGLILVVIIVGISKIFYHHAPFQHKAEGTLKSMSLTNCRCTQVTGSISLSFKVSHARFGSIIMIFKIQRNWIKLHDSVWWLITQHPSAYHKSNHFNPKANQFLLSLYDPLGSAQHPADKESINFNLIIWVKTSSARECQIIIFQDFPINKKI